MKNRYVFRGWDAMGQKGWVYGDLAHTKGISRDSDKDLYDRVMVGGYEVAPESVGQWTGLKDKKGRDIFEGDIVKTVIKDDLKVDACIRFSTDVCGFVCHVEKYGDYFLGIGKYDYDIIGTIYEQNKK